MVPVNVSVGKENGQPDGKIFYIVIYWINDTGETFNYIKKNFGGEDRVRTAAVIHNTPSKFDKLDYYCYELDKEVLPCWIVFPWEEW